MTKSKRGLRAHRKLVRRSTTVGPAKILERVHAGLALVDRAARKIARSLGGAMEMQDLVAEGRVGLLAAARRFDPKRGFSFEWYASFRVRGAILDAVRSYLAPSTYGRFLLYAAQGAKPSKSGPPRPHTFACPHRRRILNLDATLAGMNTFGPLGVVVEVTDYEEADLVDLERLDPEQELANVQLSRLLLRSIRTLPPREAELVRRHYFNNEGLDQVALDLEINKSWASRLHTRGIRRLSKRVRGVG